MLIESILASLAFLASDPAVPTPSLQQTSRLHEYGKVSDLLRSEKRRGETLLIGGRFGVFQPFHDLSVSLVDSDGTWFVNDGSGGALEIYSTPFGDSVVLRSPTHGRIEARPLGDGNAMVEQRPLNVDRECAIAHEVIPALPPRRADEGGIAGSCSDSELDVAILWTPEAMTAAGGTTAILARAYAAVEATNAAFLSSGIDTTVRLVGTREASQSEAGVNYQTLLNRLTNQADGQFDEAHALRDQTGADLVMMFVNNSEYCGVAWLAPFQADRGFSLVTWYCDPLVAAHEWGHNFGCCHAPGDGGGCDNGGVYPYALGNRFAGSSGTLWRTVMAYAPGTRISRFSSPSLIYDGVPTGLPGNGTEGRDNVRTILQTRASVTAFRCTLSPGDECSTALPANVGPNVFSTAASTTSPEAVDETQCAGTALSWGTANKDLWFSFTAPSDGDLSLNTCSVGSFDTSIVVYSGSCDALAQIACNGDGTDLNGCQTYYSNIAALAVVGGTTYYIRIGGYGASGFSESGAGELNVGFDVTSAVCDAATGSCATVHATPGCSDPVCCTSVCEFDATCCTDSWSDFCVQTAVDLCGIFAYSCVDANPAVANDCATNATVLSGDTFRDINITGCNTDGPGHIGATCVSGNDFILQDVWFRFQSVANGTFNVKTCGVNGGPVTTFDSKIAVYDMGTNPATFDYNTLNTVLVGCNDDTTCAAPGGVFPSDLTVNVTSGRWYLVRAGTYDYAGTARVTFDMPEPCALPTATVVEAEACGTSANNGCFAGGAVQQLDLGQMLRGSFWITPNSSGDLTRDTDFYALILPTDKQATVSVFSKSFVEMQILKGDIAATNCTGVNIVATASGFCPSTTSICLSAGLYYILVRPHLTGDPLACGGELSEYFLQIDAVDAPCPIVVDQICSEPGPDTTTTSVAQNTTGNSLQGCATGCGNGTGGSADMMFAASFSGANLLKKLTCVNLGVAALRSLTPPGGTCTYGASDRTVPAKLVIYRDLDGGAPVNPISTGIAGADLELIDSKDILLPGGVYMGNIEFNPPLCLENESTVVVVLETYNLFNGTGIPNGIPAGAGYRSGIGVAVPAAGLPSNVWGRYTVCTGAAQNVFAPFGAGSYEWPIQMNGVAAGCESCPADCTGDGVINASDLSAVLMAWGSPDSGEGPFSPDIDGDGFVSSNDLTLVLDAWGWCDER